MSTFLTHILSDEDIGVAVKLVGGITRLAKPDLVIAPDGEPYLYRWHVVPRNTKGNVYFHIQVASDPERPLHDHPWHNQSVILSGGYDEIVQSNPPWSSRTTEYRRKGDVVHRQAYEAHRLILPEGTPYTMSLFTTGPKVREWGYWIPSHRGRPEWVSNEECNVVVDGVSLFKEPVR